MRIKLAKAKMNNANLFRVFPCHIIDISTLFTSYKLESTYKHKLSYCGHFIELKLSGGNKKGAITGIFIIVLTYKVLYYATKLNVNL